MTQLTPPETTAISASYFGMTEQAVGYNFGPVEAWPTITNTVSRSLSVWSPGNGTISGLAWGNLNPSAGVYNWTALDSWIAECQKNNVQMIYTLCNPPAWAGGSNPDPAAYKAFMTALINHVGGAIQYYEGFNEYNASTSIFSGSASGLVALQKVLYETVHQLSPASSVLSPTYTGLGGQPMTNFLNAGGGAYFDIAAMHGYVDANGESIIQSVNNFKAALVAGGAGNKPIWDTEWSWWPDSPPPQDVQAAFLSTSLILQSALGVQREVYYAYDSIDHGLYNQTGGTLTQAGVAFKETTQWLLGATMIAGCQVSGTAYSVPLLKGGQNTQIVWNSAGNSSYSAGSFTQYQDLTGAIHNIVGGKVTIGEQPILLMTPGTIDTTAPVAPTIASFSNDTGVVGDHITNDNTLTLTGTAEANSTVVLYDGATLLGSVTANGSGAWSYTTAALTNGAHNLTATATDAAGNTGVASAGLVASIDTSAPTKPTITGDHITNNTLTVTGTAEAGSTVKLYDGATLLGNALASSTGAWSYTTAALTNGAHNLTATATDAAGNTGTASAALAVTIGTTTPAALADTTAPARPIINSFSNDSGVAGDHITNDNTLTLTGTAEANSTVKLYDGATLLGSVTANGSGAWSYTTAALTNGAHNLTATATDAAGNTGVASAGLVASIDTSAPTKPTITGDHITNNTLTVTGTAEAGSTVKLYDGATLLGNALASSTGAWSYTTAALTNGAHNLTATATDAAGNTGTASAALAVTIGTTTPAALADTTAPARPIINSFSNDSGVAGDHITNDNTLTLTGTAEANSTVKLYDGATLLGNALASSTGAWSYTTAALTNGAHNLTATATDAAGNTGVASAGLVASIDTSAPVAPTITSFSNDSGVVGDHITNDNTLTVTGTAEANSTVKLYDGATLLGSVAANGSGAWSYTTAALTNGAHNLTTTATDAAGTTSSASGTLSVSVDTTAPVAPTITSFSNDSGVVGDHITNDNTLTVTGTAEANSTVKLYDGATLLGSVAANGSGAWSYTTAALTNGAHNLTTTATDAAGTTSSASGTLSVSVDTTAPVAPTITSFSNDSGVAGDHITNDNTLTLTGTAEANSTVKLYDGATLLGNALASSTGAWSYTTAALANGAHHLTTTATDSAGNTSSASGTLSVSVDTTAPVAPTTTSFSNDSGVAGDHITNDNTLTLTGTAEANSTVKLYDGATLLGNALASSTGAWSYTTAALANGAHHLTTTATNSAGNTGAHSTALTVAVDAASSDHGPGATGGAAPGSSGHGTGTTAPGSIELWTLGFTDDHAAPDMIGHAVAEKLGNLHLGHWFENHLFAARTLHQLESAMSAGPTAHDSGTTHIRPSDSVFHGATAGDLSLQDPAAAHLIIASHPHDKVSGGPNADVLIVGPGQHTLTGSGGADAFVIGTGHVNATITDFTPGVDNLEFVGSAGQGHRTVQIRQELGNAVVTVGSDHIVLTGVDMHQLQPHDLTHLLV